jgi:hypothetical protein
MRGGAGGAAGRDGKYGKPPACSCDGCPYGKGDSLRVGSESRKDTLSNIYSTSPYEDSVQLSSADIMNLCLKKPL